MDERIGFEERKTVDMKIYQVPADTARWFKIWCDRQGLRFNQGMVLVKHIIEDYERFKKIELVIEEDRTMLTEMYEKVMISKEQSVPEQEAIVESTPDKPTNTRKRIATFGSNR